MHTRTAVVAAAVGLFGLLAACDGGATPRDASQRTVGTDGSLGYLVYDTNATVERVVDGDTVVLDIDGRRERVRLIGIDTPETKKPDTPVQCYGPEASARTEQLLPEGTPVLLQRDLEARDDFDRLLGYVFLTDGTFVNLDLVENGFARPLRIEPNTAYAQQFADAARAAEAAGLGLWGACPG